MTLLSPRARLLAWLGLALTVRTVANLLTLNFGFQAISDDDFARVAIAQNFAHEPRWDASGTSWLPVPFWLTGSVMSVFGTSYSVARAVAWFTSLGSVVGFFWCCRVVGLRSVWLGLASCCFATLPHAVWLGLATVPEGFVAVLTLAGMCTAVETGGAALGGAACLLVATLSRYETWPVAFVVAAHHLVGVYRAGRPQRWPTSRAHATPWTREARWRTAALLLCLTGPIAWLLHGLVNHDDAFFFVKRVQGYREALGGSPKQWLDVLGNYPRALIEEEESIIALLFAAIVVRRWHRSDTAGPALLPSELPLLWSCLALVGFLVWGDVTNGAPTHHPERTLLPCWLATLVLAAGVLGRSSANPTGTFTPLYMAGLGVVTLSLGFDLWLQIGCQGFVNRSAELTLGGLVGPHLKPDTRLWLETEGYGYVAVSVGTERPWLVDGFNANDPRQSRASPPFADPIALAAFLRERKIVVAMMPASRRAAFEGWAKLEADVGPSLIFRIPAVDAAENSVPRAD